MKTIRTLLGAGLLLASGIASATVTDAEFQALKDQLSQLTRQLEELQKERAQEKAQAAQAAPAQAAPVAAAGAAVAATAPAAAPAGGSWVDRFALTGDFRYRHEMNDQEGAPYQSRDRLRVRFGFTARASDTLSAGVVLATGGDSPVSSNQTFDNGFSRKSIGLDQGWLDWSPVKGFHTIGGKFKTPFYRVGGPGAESELIWDDDLRPEGLAATYDAGPFFGSAAVLFAKENATAAEYNPSANDVLVYGVQGGGRLDFGDAGKFNLGVGFYDANSLKNMAALYDPEATIAAGKTFSSTTTFGNTYYVFTDSKGNQTKLYEYGYQELEGFAEYVTKVLKLPVRIYGDYVKNLAATGGGDTGWRAGLTLGEVKGWKSGAVSYYYENLGRDAVVGLWTDSDFGNGGTNNRGHVMTGTLGLTERANIRVRYFLNEQNIAAPQTRDYNRLQLDFNLKY